MAKNVLGYIRRSLESENLSLQAQEKSIRSFAESQSWNLLKVYCDSGDSGKNMNRSAFQEMLHTILIGDKIDLIIVPKLDRISRSLKDILILIEDKLAPFDVGLKSVTESFDTSTSEGRLLLSLLAGFAEFERKRIVERMMDGKYQLAENGGFTGGHLPFGYKKNSLGNGIIPDEYESKIVQRIFQLFVSNGLSSQKIKVATGCPLHRDSITDLLSNPVYAGLIEYDGKISQGTHEALISVRLFNKAQETKLLKARNTSSLFRLHGTHKIPLKLTTS